MHQGWPKFAASLWMAGRGGGVAAIANAPCELRTRISGVPVAIFEETEYPFDGLNRFVLTAGLPAAAFSGLLSKDRAKQSQQRIPT
jgi:hypothetical protein